MKELNKRAKKAARRYLELQGYGIVDKNWSNEAIAGKVDLVAEDGGAIVFVTVSVGGLDRDAGFREEPLSREQAELLAATWLGEHPDAGINVPIRFDRISILVVGQDRAMLRHTVNCLGIPGTTC